MVAQFVNGALVADHPARLLLVASGTLLLGATTPCLLPGGDMTGQPVHDAMDDDRNGASRMMLGRPVNDTNASARGASYTQLHAKETNHVASGGEIPYTDNPGLHTSEETDVV
jgi:hypothetical protein